MNAYAAIPWTPKCSHPNMLQAPALAIGPLDGDVVTQLITPRLLVSRIQREVADFYGIAEAEMKSARRARDISHPRQLAMYLARELTPKSYPELGRLFGDRDHTTVMFAVRQVEDRLQRYADFRADVALLRKSLAA